MSVQFRSGIRCSMGLGDAVITGSVGCSIKGDSTRYRETDRGLTSPSVYCCEPLLLTSFHPSCFPVLLPRTSDLLILFSFHRSLLGFFGFDHNRKLAWRALCVVAAKEDVHGVVSGCVLYSLLRFIFPFSFRFVLYPLCISFAVLWRPGSFYLDCGVLSRFFGFPVPSSEVRFFGFVGFAGFDFELVGPVGWVW